MAAELYAAKHQNPFAALSNPAGITILQSHAVGVLAEHRFALQELKYFQAAGAIRLQNSGIGLQISYTGYSGGNVSNIALAYGRQLVESLAVGAAFHYITLSQPAAYGNAQSVTASIGLLAKPTEQVSLAAYAFNPLRVGWFKQNEITIPSLYRFGAGYQPSDKLLLTSELVKEEDLPVSIRGMIDYGINKLIRIKLGVASGSNSIFSGVVVQFKAFRFDVITAYHQQLGFSPGSSLIFPFGKTNTDAQ